MRTSIQSDARLQALRRLVRSELPQLSVYLHAAPPEDPEAEQLTLRWKGLREQLAERGTPEADLACVDAEVAAHPLGDRVLTVFVAGGEVVLSAMLEGSDEPDGATVEAWAQVLPLLRWEQNQPSVVTAVVGHREASLTVHEYGRQVSQEVLTGPDDEIEHNAPGGFDGWSQSRYQRRAEDSWAHNAAAYAKRISELAEHSGARLVALTGDPREVQLVKEKLPAEVAKLVATDVKAKPVHGTVKVTEEDLRSVVETANAAVRRQVIAEFDDAGGRGLAVEGVVDVHASLEKKAVARLYVVRGAAEDGNANAMACQAIDSDADVVVLEPDELPLSDGLGALLRF